MSWLQITIYVLVAIMGAGVVLTRDPLPQAVVASMYGLLLTILFVILQAPDVALSELVIGGSFYPLMVLLAVAKATGKGAE